jgi:hypothetical protein
MDDVTAGAVVAVATVAGNGSADPAGGDAGTIAIDAVVGGDATDDNADGTTDVVVVAVVKTGALALDVVDEIVCGVVDEVNTEVFIVAISDDVDGAEDTVPLFDDDDGDIVLVLD